MSLFLKRKNWSLSMHESEEIEINVDPTFLVTTAIEFPCFADAKAVQDKDALFEIMMNSYSDDDLTEAQDLVMEFIFHLSSQDAQFNLHQAIKIWDKDDIEIFSKIVREQSELLQ